MVLNVAPSFPMGYLAISAFFCFFPYRTWMTLNRGLIPIWTRTWTHYLDLNRWTSLFLDNPDIGLFFFFFFFSNLGITIYWTFMEFKYLNGFTYNACLYFPRILPGHIMLFVLMRVVAIVSPTIDAIMLYIKDHNEN